MPCNLAVSITKAAVADEQLQALLTPQAVSVVVSQYLTAQYGQRQGVTVTSQSPFLARVGSVTVRIEQGRVNVETAEWPTTADRQFATQLADELTRLLAQAADVLFAQQVQRALLRLAPVTAQTITVDNQGVPQQAVVLTMKF